MKQTAASQMGAGFMADYVRALRTLSRKHKIDDVDVVNQTIAMLKKMSYLSEIAGRGELWIPAPDKLTGHYPVIEDIPYNALKTMLRKNTGEDLRQKAKKQIIASTRPFVPLNASTRGTLNPAQRRALLANILVSVPLQKGNTPGLLGRVVPGDIGALTRGAPSVIPLHEVSPEEWTQRGFTMRKFSLKIPNLQKILRNRARKPRLRMAVPQLKNMSVVDTVKRVMQDAQRVKIETDAVNYAAKDPFSVEELEMLKKLKLESIGRRIGIAKVIQKRREQAALERNLVRLKRGSLKGGTIIAGSVAAALLLNKLRNRKQNYERVNINPTIQRGLASMATVAPERIATAKRRLRNAEVIAKAKIAQRAATKRRFVIPKHAGKVAALSTGVLTAKMLMRRRKKAQSQQQFNLTALDRLNYESGFQERWIELKRRFQRRKRLTEQWMKQKILPALAHQTVTNLSQLAQTEFGTAPMLIGNQPTARVGFNPKLQSLSSGTLRSLTQEIRSILVQEDDPNLRKGLEKDLSAIMSELAIRNLLV